MSRRAIFGVLILSLLLGATAHAADFVPDPASVQREGPAYRYPQAGWIVLHVEGEPYERGMQQGKLLWREIGDYIKCFANEQSSKSPGDAWKMMRTMTDAMFLRRFDAELLEEMKGIADGAAAAGATFDGRPIDLTDIVAVNIWPEIMSLDDALHAQPTGLEGKDFDKLSKSLLPATRTSRCSAFAATGPATKDGKAIIGHITMFDLYPCDFFNVWIDVKPAKGHRLVIQGAPGSVQSGMDWYINDAGIVLTETTIAQTRFEPNGMSIGSRSRHAMQYGDSIDAVVNLLGDHGNGLYTNEWILADMKTNEIAMFELGTKTSRLLRSSKGEWFGNTPGFYWGCNNTKDIAVRLETIAGANDRPADMTFEPWDRDIAWQNLYEQNKGHIDADFGKLAFSKPPLVSRHSCDAKYTTADMALQLKSFAHWGDPYGQLWDATHEDRERSPEIQPIVPNDWTVLTTQAPGAAPAQLAVDLATDSSDKDEADSSEEHDRQQPPPAWHGTLLPAEDGDLWLASAFAGFHEYAAHEREMLKGHQKDAADSDGAKAKSMIDQLSANQRDELAVAMFGYRSAVLQAAATRREIPLRKIKFDPSDDTWFHSAKGRGALLLAELRRRMGADAFDAAMDVFGRAHAGQATETRAFVDALSPALGAGAKDFFARWLDSTDALPTLQLRDVKSAHKGSDYTVSGQIMSRAGCAPGSVDVTLETADGETTSTFAFDSGTAKFQMTSAKQPTRIIVNKYGQTPITNGWIWNTSAFKNDLEHTLIIYGTKMEADANRIAAGKLQEAIIAQWQHAVVPIKSDTQATGADLRGYHVLLVGRPECSDLTARLASYFPATFGPRSFSLRGQTYANADSAIIAACANPSDARFSLVCIAGNSALATLRAAQAAPHGGAPIKLLVAHGHAKDVVPPARELVQELD
ncbi:MAG TPA: C45 family autoproteolytic acyltransferase/hydrolase [Humisphaera sp.]|jgi:hypothetical protein|nr:C45 family autoproteolytic acyltransferase/hydrolase [Humisphaera sp.]